MTVHHKKRTFCEVCEQHYSEVIIEIEQEGGWQLVSVWCCSCGHPNNPCEDELDALPKLNRAAAIAIAINEVAMEVKGRLGQQEALRDLEQDHPITPEYLDACRDMFIDSCMGLIDGGKELRHGPDYSRHPSRRQEQEHGGRTRKGRNPGAE